MELTVGNYTELIFGPLQDQTGAIFDDLASAENIIFVLKQNATDTNENAAVSADKNSGITIDSPSTGYIKVVLDSDIMDLDPGKYYIAVQVNMSATRKEEIKLYENGRRCTTVNVVQDVIR